MDPTQSINTTKLATLISNQVQKSQTPDAQRVVLDLATEIGESLHTTFGNQWNQGRWLDACGITPEFREQVTAAA